jgi:hypothetical protein
LSPLESSTGVALKLEVHGRRSSRRNGLVSEILHPYHSPLRNHSILLYAIALTLTLPQGALNCLLGLHRHHHHHRGRPEPREPRRQGPRLRRAGAGCFRFAHDGPGQAHGANGRKRRGQAVHCGRAVRGAHPVRADQNNLPVPLVRPCSHAASTDLSIHPNQAAPSGEGPGRPLSWSVLFRCTTALPAAPTMNHWYLPPVDSAGQGTSGWASSRRRGACGTTTFPRAGTSASTPPRHAGARAWTTAGEQHTHTHYWGAGC